MRSLSPTRTHASATVAVIPIVLVALALISCDHAKPLEHTPLPVTPFYTDGEARAFMKHAPTIIPSGEALRKNVVFARLGIDTKRFRSYRVVEVFSVFYERYQISPGFDIEWMAVTQDSTPLDREDRAIYGLKVVPKGKK